MYTKILVPLDGSHIAEQILPYVRSFARALSLPVELLHAVDPDVITQYSDPKHGRYTDEVVANLKQRALNYLRKVAGSFSKPSEVTASAEIGKPAEAILGKATAHPNTLIAMSTHGRSGAQRWLLGSIAYKVLHAAANPMLLVRPTGESKSDGEAALKAVVVPLDGSGVAEKVLPHVTALAKTMKQEVILLQAYSVPFHAFGEDVYTPRIDRIIASMREEATSYLAAKVQQLQAEGLDKVTYVLLDGYPEEEIIAFAQRTPDNIVAMCSHGRSGVGRWILGSVAERVVRHCGDPVLIVRPSPTA